MNIIAIKKIGLLMLLGLPSLVFAQDGKYTLRGKIGVYNAPAKVYMQYRLGKDKWQVDSAGVVGGKFEFSGTTEIIPKRAVLLFSAKGGGYFHSSALHDIYLEPGIINVNTTDELVTATVSGSKTNDDNERYLLAQKSVNDAYAALKEKRDNATPEQQNSPAFMKQNEADENIIFKRRAEVDKKFISENPDSFISLNAFELYTYTADYPEIGPLFDRLSPTLKATETGKMLAERMPKIKAVALGAIAPEFAEPDTSGKMVSLSSFRGKYVLVDFWASWCAPCRQENVNAVEVYNHYKNKKFTILSVSLDKANGKGNWLAAIHKDGLTWTQVSDLKYWNNQAADLYAVHAVPQNFLLDPNGKIIAKNLLADELENKLAEVLGKM